MKIVINSEQNKIIPDKPTIISIHAYNVKIIHPIHIIRMKFNPKKIHCL